MENKLNASIVLLLPALIFLALLGLTVKVTVTLWKRALTNREFRDNMLQLEATVGNSIEAVRDGIKNTLRFQ